MKNLKKLTILHSNDMHGDFMAQEKDKKLIGGVSMLSGYLNKVRREEKNVIYTISGDMFRGNVIDSEYKGISTIEIMNMLAPDVVTLGNHEADYGIAGGRGEGLVFSHGEIIEKVPEDRLVDRLIEIISSGS
jgi:5'-nucleotidase